MSPELPKSSRLGCQKEGAHQLPRADTVEETEEETGHHNAAALLQIWFLDSLCKTLPDVCAESGTLEVEQEWAQGG